VKAPDLDPREVQPAVEALAESEAKAKAEGEEAPKPFVYRPWVPRGRPPIRWGLALLALVAGCRHAETITVTINQGPVAAHITMEVSR
jgi:hypothetical protein